MATIDYYSVLTQRFTFDNTWLLFSAAVSFSVGYIQYIYAIRLSLRDGKGWMPFWMHSFYLAHDSVWSYVLSNIAPQYNGHWFLRATSTALLVWSALEVYCIWWSVTKGREATFSSILGPNPGLRPVLWYVAMMQVGMYCIVILLMQLMGDGCLMQWFCLTNVVIVMGPTHEYLRRSSRDGLSLGLCLVNIFGTAWTFAPFGFWVSALPEIFDTQTYYFVGSVFCAYAIWTFSIVAGYPPKASAKKGGSPIW
ncbi:hypothetical protein EDB81DRAFT_639090 [Dactylonectria macrodidyma]|uniref:Uncharacterized protein n=1 Tax=Dactylonectria macrodidyma TaxID=307937 RepID=A0A9P9JGQ3_9HYPO|nr:hypothetical protein EDB81DRAFT_639090 [Dactylonectria macrodidyma]